MARENVDIIVNGGVWNNVPQSGIIAGLSELAMENIKYMSKEAMVTWLYEACNLAEETLEWKKNATLSRKIKQIREYFNHHDPDRQTTMNILINVILSGQGLGTLSGFGYGKSGSAYQTNPEIMAMRDVKE